MRGTYKLRSQNFLLNDNGPFESVFVEIRNSWQIDSATGDVITFSMSGYGKPAMIWINLASHVATGAGFNYNWVIAGDTSLVYVSLMHSISFGSLDVTFTMAVYIKALIASR